MLRHGPPSARQGGAAHPGPALVPDSCRQDGQQAAAASRLGAGVRGP